MSDFFCLENAHSGPNRVWFYFDPSSTRTPPTLYYCYDTTSWQRYYVNTYLDLDVGEKVYFYGLNSYLGFGTEINVRSDEAINASGNIITLLDSSGSKYIGGNRSVFAGLFRDCTTLVSCANLSMPSTTLGAYCYRSTFAGCTSLIDFPQLPSSWSFAYDSAGFADHCSGMFQNCTSLREVNWTVPSAVGTNSYSYMFAGCTSLIKAPDLSGTSLGRGSHDHIFDGCISLVVAPRIDTFISGDHWGLSNAFAKCISLKVAPKMPNINIFGGFSGMFYNCISLEIPPKLPQGSSVPDSCFSSMFYGCSSLKYLPNILATNFAQYSCSGMFNGCKSIKISIEQTDECKYLYRIPKEGTGSAGSNAFQNMFSNTGGSFTGTPQVNTEYYVNFNPDCENLLNLNINNLELLSDDISYTIGEDKVIQLVPAYGFSLPLTISVTGASYTYDNTTGIITLSNLTDYVVILADGVWEPLPAPTISATKNILSISSSQKANGYIIDFEEAS